MRTPASALILLCGVTLPLLAQTQDTITVTASRTPAPLADSTASIAVISKETLATTASATVDDALRQVPGFTLFRRSGSATANPTSQGVSLRGVGASGASRAVVLDDGVPLNDAFGGWVYWGRVPRAAVERIEVLRGGASDLYGSGATGGVVQFVRRAEQRGVVAVDASAGSMRTGATSVFATAGLGDWIGTFGGDFFSTDGYVLVDPDQRGAIDRDADSRHRAMDASAARHFAGGDRIFVRASHYNESRNNGTPVQVNDTTTAQIAAGADAATAGGSLLLRAYASDQDYHQTFSAIAGDRNSERLTVDQRVPSRSVGASMQFSRAIAERHAIVAGAESRRVTGESDEVQYALNGSVTNTVSGGRQSTGSLFVHDVIEVTPGLALTAGVRFDSWRDVALTDRSDTAWSPRLSALYHASDRVTIIGSAYRAFRAPTLNELYRSFRVGNVITLANEHLGAEHLTAFEAGTRIESADRRRAVRATLFSMTTDDAVANVTLSTTPSLITRQRQNLGSSRSRGIELEGESRIGERWRLSAGYLFSDATVSTGTQVPQIPRNQATAQLVMNMPRDTFAVQTRWSGPQYDDDLNQFPLRSYVLADAFVSHALTPNVMLTLAAENLSNARVEVSATPVYTLGPSRAVRLGVRYAR